MAESPFLASANTNTATQGSIWTVLVQPSFADLVFEASALVTKGAAHQAAVASGTPKTSSHLPSEFALRIKEAAQATAGVTGARADKEEIDESEPFVNEDAGESNEQETEEIKETKRTIVERVWTKVQPACFTKTDDRELEATINLLLTLLLSFFPPAHPKFYGFALQLLEAIATAEGKTTSYGRYAAIFTLFNALPGPTEISDNQPPLQLTILSRLADMTATHLEDLNILLPSLLRLPSYLTQWNLISSRIGVSVIEKVVRVCEQGGKQMDAFSLSVAYLSSPALVEGDLSPDIDRVAEFCIRLGLTLPDYHDWDLLDDISPISRYLASNPEGKQRYSTLITLLKCPTTKCEQVEQEVNSNAYLSKVISEDAKLRIQKKARLLSLTELCGSRVGGEVKYSEVKECLGLATPIEEDDGMEVEEWVINAVKAKLITARLHQPSQVIFVTKATYRSFRSSQWGLLQTKLKSWGNSINHLIQVVDEGLASIDNNRQGSGNDGNANKGSNKLVTASA